MLLPLWVVDFMCKHILSSLFQYKKPKELRSLTQPVEKWHCKRNMLVFWFFLWFWASLGSKELMQLVNVGMLPQTQKLGSWLLVKLQHKMRKLPLPRAAVFRWRRSARTQTAFVLSCFLIQLKALESSQKLLWPFPSVATLLIVQWVTSVEVCFHL